MLILDNLRQHIDPSEAEIEYLLGALIPRPFKKGEVLVRAGDPARHLTFVNAGYLVTCYTDDRGVDHVIQFAGEGWWSGDIHSLSDQPQTPYTTRALSDGEVLLLPRLAHRQLLDNFPVFERYFRITFQRGLLRQQRRARPCRQNERYDKMDHRPRPLRPPL